TGGKFTLGADASVAAGPVGRQASAATDTSFKAEVYSYSRTRGVFAGLAVDGTALTIDDDANEVFYGKPDILASDIIGGKIHTSNDSARRFMTAVSTGTGTVASATTTTAQAPITAPTNGVQSDAPAPMHSSPPTGATSFPMEDQNPGREPK